MLERERTSYSPVFAMLSDLIASRLVACFWASVFTTGPLLLRSGASSFAVDVFSSERDPPRSFGLAGPLEVSKVLFLGPLLAGFSLSCGCASLLMAIKIYGVGRTAKPSDPSPRYFHRSPRSLRDLGNCGKCSTIPRSWEPFYTGPAYGIKTLTLGSIMRSKHFSLFGTPAR